MKIGDGLGQILSDMAADKVISGQQVDALRGALNDLEARVHRVTGSMDSMGIFRLDRAYADQILWLSTVMPLAWMFAASSQTLADGVTETVNLSNWELHTPRTRPGEFSISGTDLLREAGQISRADLYLAIGTFSFATNSSGTRSASVEENGGATPWAVDLFALNANVTNDWTVCPFASVLRISNTAATGFRFKVMQGSGGNLGLENGDILVAMLGRDIN